MDRPRSFMSTESNPTIARKHVQETPPLQLADPLVRHLLASHRTTPTTTPFSSSLKHLPELEPQSLGNDKTVLYLAYGSNLAASTFQGKRGIQPLSSINVLVPSLKLTFDLPGLPYAEPCFANTNVRDPSHPMDDDSSWRHGLVGVVYEVTREDFAHIINTEGGGSSYKDVKVLCYPLSRGLQDVPSPPTGVPFTAHTLLADRLSWLANGDAEPSERYKGLLTTGAAENELPSTYQAYLAQLPSYHATSFGQRAGKWLIIIAFGPFLALLWVLFTLYGNDKGKAPKWVASLAELMFKGMYKYYTVLLKPLCGDGQKTVRGKNGKTQSAEGTLEKGIVGRAKYRDADRETEEQTPLLGGRTA